MRIGVVKEIKDKENRVALTPTGVRRLQQAGHDVLVQQGAGLESGFSDAAYTEAGARLVEVEQAWDTDMVVKIKEPLAAEYPFLKQQILFTYLHLAGVPDALTQTLLEQETTAIAYETVEDNQGRLPLLAPMSAVAGNMAVTIGSYYLAKFNHGNGMQLGSVLGQCYGKVVIVGDGVVGRHAARTATGMGTQVYIFSRQPERATQLKAEISAHLNVVESKPQNLMQHLVDADLLVGGVLLPGAKAPHVVTEAMVKQMQAGSVIVDVSIDQGGCIATSRPTSHSDPVFEKHGVIHYCVTNMPGAYPRTSTIALTSATLPYVIKLAAHGIDALNQDKGFGKGLNTYKGHIMTQPVAAALGRMAQFEAWQHLA